MSSHRSETKATSKGDSANSSSTRSPSFASSFSPIGFPSSDPLTGDAEGAPNLFEGSRLIVVEAEPKLDHLARAFGQHRERVLDVLTSQRDQGHVEGRLGQLVLDKVPELRVLVFADWLLERDGKLRHPQDLPHLLGCQLELRGDLVG